MYNKELGIIGIGKIGSVLLKKAISNQINPDDIIIYDIDEERLVQNAQKFGVVAAKSNKELVQSVKHVLIAVIPQVIDNVLEEIGALVTTQQTVITIAAGVSIAHLNKFISKDVGIVRIMTNTPLLVDTGATVIAYNENVNINALQFVKSMFNSLGMVVELGETHLDAVTGLSGSGPAYIFIIIEALADGGVKMGLPRDVAIKLAAQTVMGAAKMVLETKKHTGELKDMVATPAGTTIAAIHELESAKLRATLINAVEAATLRSRSLNQSFKK